jgi:hypothetical protein
MKKDIVYLLFFMASLTLGSGCGGGTESPEESRSPGNLGHNTESGRLDRAEREYSPVLGKISTPLSRPGALTVNIGRAGSVLPSGAMRVFVAFDEVSVYRGGEGWSPLPLNHDPYRIEPFSLPLWTSAALTQSAELPPGEILPHPYWDQGSRYFDSKLESQDRHTQLQLKNREEY